MVIIRQFRKIIDNNIAALGVALAIAASRPGPQVLLMLCGVDQAAAIAAIRSNMDRFESGGYIFQGTCVPFRIACAHNQINSARYMMSMGMTKIDLMSHYGDALRWACSQPDPALLESLVRGGIDSENLFEHSNVAIWWASFRRNDQVLVWIAKFVGATRFIPAFARANHCLRDRVVAMTYEPSDLDISRTIAGNLFPMLAAWLEAATAPPSEFRAPVE